MEKSMYTMIWLLLIVAVAAAAFLIFFSFSKGFDFINITIV